jgi:broad specificity phosphatase PhoE
MLDLNKKKMKQRYILQIVLVLVAVFQYACVGTFYVVRHAEKLNDTPDSPLSAQGFQRAATLADSLFAKGIDTIFVSTRQRTQQTARPLALRLNKQMKIYGLDTVASFSVRIKNIKKSVLIVSHTNFIPDIVQTISGQTVPAIVETDFDNMYKITVKRNWMGQTTRSLVIGRYGVVSQ